MRPSLAVGPSRSADATRCRPAAPASSNGQRLRAGRNGHTDDGLRRSRSLYGRTPGPHPSHRHNADRYWTSRVFHPSHSALV